MANEPTTQTLYEMRKFRRDLEKIHGKDLIDKVEEIFKTFAPADLLYILSSVVITYCKNSKPQSDILELLLKEFDIVPDLLANSLSSSIPVLKDGMYIILRSGDIRLIKEGFTWVETSTIITYLNGETGKDRYAVSPLGTYTKDLKPRDAFNNYFDVMSILDSNKDVLWVRPLEREIHG